ncbi:MAG: glycoside hydrolase family 31 protein [Cytophagales bacterium]
MANSISSSLGSFVSYSKHAQGVDISAAQGNLCLTLYGDSVVRVWAFQSEKPEDFSYAVVGTPLPTLFEVVESGDSLELATSTLKTIINKKNLAIHFVDLRGGIINQDDELGVRWIGEQVNCYKKLQEGERFLGLGEKTGPLDKRGRGYINWNTDAYAYSPDGDPLYCSIPFYIGIHDQKQYGIYFDNSFRTLFNFGASNDRFASFSADSGEMKYYFIAGDSLREIIKSYTYLTGRTPLPPKWSIGYQQCRYSYYPDTKVERIAETLRERDLPGDAIVLDIHYMDAYKIFTWDKQHFPEPKKLLDKLKALGFHVVVMCDPGIKVEPGYETYESGVKEEIFVKYPDGTNYTGQVWPGWCHFPDFTKEKTRQWWASKFKDYVDMGVEGFWNDMNEIATWGNMLPDLMEFDFDGRKTTSREARNLYGMQMSRSTYEGTKALLKKRPFNLTRSGFAGIQRYAAVWTGDNVSYDAHMMAGVRLVNSMGLSGLAFTGYDIGGFVGNADEKLFARWMSIGAFSPFFRTHTMINSRDSEPWSYGEKVEEISRNYMKLRYRLMPYLYSLFYDAAKTGMPINRSLAFDYPHDYKIYDGLYQNQYFFGPAIMVAPVESAKDLAKVYLPQGNWYDLYTDQAYTGDQEMAVDCPMDRLPVFVKGSSIITMAERAGKNVNDLGTTLEVHLYKGQEYNDFTLYEDDGETFNHEKGEYVTRKISYTPHQNELIIEPAVGSFTSAFTQVNVFFHGFDLHTVSVNGKPSTVERKDYRFVNPISNYDPINTMPEGAKIASLPYVGLAYGTEKISMKW